MREQEDYYQMHQYMKVDKETEILIYGVNVRSKILYQQMVDQQYCVRGFIDRNASVHQQSKDMCNINILSIDAARTLEQKERKLIVIGLRDTRKHYEVAEELAGMGYSFILFLPIDGQVEERASRILCQAYNSCVWEDIENIGVIPNFIISRKRKFDYEQCIFDRDQKYIYCWMPRELLYTCPTAWVEKTRKIQGASKWEYVDVPLKTQLTYMRLMEFLDHKDSGEYKSYIQEYNKQHGNVDGIESDQAILTLRADWYQKYVQKMRMGNTYFKQTAAVVEWNSKGYFNIIDGNHRASFLVERGYDYLPVRMNCSDFEIWHNAGVAKECEDYIDNHHIEKTMTAIPNPHFFDVSAIREYESEKILDKVQILLQKIDVTSMNVLECGIFQSYFARNLCRMGAKEIYALEMDDANRGFVDILNRLQYQNRIKIIGNLDDIKEEKIDIVFLLGMQNFDMGFFNRLLTYLIKVGCKILFWESYTNTVKEREQILECNHFSYYYKFYDTFYNDSICESGVFVVKEFKEIIE